MWLSCRRAGPPIGRCAAGEHVKAVARGSTAARLSRPRQLSASHSTTNLVLVRYSPMRNAIWSMRCCLFFVLLMYMMRHSSSSCCVLVELRATSTPVFASTKLSGMPCSAFIHLLPCFFPVTGTNATSIAPPRSIASRE